MLVSQKINFLLSEILSERSFPLYFAKIWLVSIITPFCLCNLCFWFQKRYPTSDVFSNRPLQCLKIVERYKSYVFDEKKDDFKPRLIHVFGNVCA